jgi:uncharacterized protein YjbJ (UPF0337 family)
MEQNDIMQRWGEIKRSLQTLWGNLREDELDRTYGNLTQVSEMVHAKTGESRESIRDKIDTMLNIYDEESPNESSFNRAPMSDGQDHSLKSFGSYESRDAGADSESPYRIGRGEDQNSDLSDVNF